MSALEAAPTRSPFWVFTAAGASFDFADPRPEMIDPRALAWQLSGEGRWANNTWFHLSVAQHSLMVARALPPAWRIYGLLHDAAEAFTRDLSTPFKLWLVSSGADVLALERRILGAVWARFELAAPSAEIAKAVDEADARALATEYRDVVRGKGPDWVPKAPPFAGPAVRSRTREAVEADFLKALDEMSRDAHSAGLRVLQ